MPATKSITIPSFSIVNENKSSIQIGLMDALSLIPEFSGENEIEFVYFREGCRYALDALEDSNKYAKLLPFIKSKLKGNAFTSFGLKITTYLSISDFLKDVKLIYAPKCDDPLFWSTKMMETVQTEGQSLKEYIAKFQEMLQCAILGIKYNETKQVDQMSKKKSKEEEIKDIQDLAATQFIKNMRPCQLQRDLETYFKRFSSKNLFKTVRTAIKFDDEDEAICPRMCDVCGSSDHSESECDCIIIGGVEGISEDELQKQNAECNATEQSPNVSNNIHKNHQNGKGKKWPKK